MSPLRERDERGISPVVGVVMLIVLLLATVSGEMILSMVGVSRPPPMYSGGGTVETIGASWS